MRILICGAGGFIGHHLTLALERAGHEVLRGVRQARAANDVAIDFGSETTVAQWLPRLVGVDAVVNAVGVLRDRHNNPMQALHDAAPRALFAACAQQGVARIVQVSALGVGGPTRTRYFTSREAANHALTQLDGQLRYLLLRPSLLHGVGGASTRLWIGLARLPVFVLPAQAKNARLQPAHIDDLTDAVTRWLDDPAAKSRTVDVVGSCATDLPGLIASYRAQLGLPPARCVPIPRPLAGLAARVGDRIPASLLCSDTLRMLEAGSHADPATFTELLGRSPRCFEDFIQEANQ